MGWDTNPWLRVSFLLDVTFKILSLWVTSLLQKTFEMTGYCLTRKKGRERGKVYRCSAMLYKKSKTLQIYKYGFFLVHYFTRSI